MKKLNFMNLSKEYSQKGKSSIYILPISFIQKATTRNYSYKGAKEILKASRELEYFDDELKVEGYLKGIYNFDILDFKDKYSGDLLSENISEKLNLVLKKDRFNIFLGSDHWTTHGIIKSFEKIYDDFGIISFDAHLDLREIWGEDTWYHACVLREISKNHDALIVGHRSCDFYENKYLKENKNISSISSKESNNDLKNTHFKFLLKKLPKKVYVTFDVDVFDPSILRNTDTPEPGGLLWNKILSLFKIIFKEKEVIGIDVVEFAPRGPEWNYKAEAYMLSKLVYKFCIYKYFLKNKK